MKKTTSKLLSLLLALTLVLSLAACGGGGSETTDLTVLPGPSAAAPRGTQRWIRPPWKVYWAER